MTIRRIACLLVLMAAGCGGAPGATAREPVELLAGLMSYESPAQSRARLPSAEWTIRSLPADPPENKTPQYERQIAEVRWRECGQDGILTLTFVNERLYTTMFAPSDVDACLKDLTRRGMTTRTPNPDERRHFYTGDSQGRPFVAALDTRLNSEIAAWIGRYS